MWVWVFGGGGGGGVGVALYTTLGPLSATFNEGDNFCGFLFAFLCIIYSPLERNLL